jgi:hypothetical protein
LRLCKRVYIVRITVESNFIGSARTYFFEHPGTHKAHINYFIGPKNIHETMIMTKERNFPKYVLDADVHESW